MATANGWLFLQSLHYCTIASILMQSCITEDILKIWKKQQSVCSGNFENFKTYVICPDIKLPSVVETLEA